MDENGNGQLEHVSKILERVHKGLERRQGELLRDWAQDYPLVRELILGGEIDNQSYPACSLLLRRDQHDLVGKITANEYELEAIVRDNSFCQILEQFEGNLGADTMPWQLTWAAVKREKDRIASKRRGS